MTFTHPSLPTELLLVQLFDLLLHLRRRDRLQELLWRDADGHRGAGHDASANGRGIHAVCRNLQRCELDAGAQEVPQVVIDLKLPEDA